MKGGAVCALFILVSVAFLGAEAKRHSHRLKTRSLDRKAQSLSDAEKAEVLKSHNDKRRQEGASNMQIMSWNDDLAKMAGAWAEKCIYDHDKSFLKPPSSLGYDTVGQNLAATTAPSVDITSTTQAWYNEKSDYNYDTGGCSAIFCGHYTQVVWAESRLIGCAYSHCDSVAEAGPDFKNAIVYVCNYAPGGNRPGERPFKKGPPCSECANKSDKCNEGLCDGN